ncbi:MAG: MFS transporter [Hyphomicrobiaceae bacterium]|nr:MFS transporter [Hyphomicrobiaceae bacterium]
MTGSANLVDQAPANVGPHEPEAAASRIAAAVVIGRTTEFFDFFVYGIASVLVFPKIFFNAPDLLTAMLYSFAVFSLAFLARPVGTLIFMALDRKFGPAVKLIAALFLLCGSTMAISFLPGYADIGWVAPVLLAVFRIGQGLGLGGAWDGLPSLLALNAPPHRRGWYSMIPQLGAAVGFILASALFIVFTSLLTTEEFLAWGWRFPFFVALALNVVALFARLRLILTPEFAALFKQRELQPQPVFRTLRAHGREILVGAFIPLASYAMFHLVTIFPLSWVTLNTTENVSHFLGVELIGAVLGGISIMLSGVIADRIGRRKLLTYGAIAIAVFSFLTAPLFNAGVAGHYAFVLVGFVLLGLSLGQARGAVASRFSHGYRYTASAMTSDIAWLIGAGFAPIVALGLSSRFDITFAGYYLLSGAICTLLALAVVQRTDPAEERPAAR